MNQKEKTKFRSTSKWYKFKAFKKKECSGLDYISGAPLQKKSSLHHLDEKHYDDLKPEKFVFLNKTTHAVVHFLFRFYRKDPAVIERLEEVLKKMLEFENES